MSLHNPGIDTRHIIKQAVNARGLANAAKYYGEPVPEIKEENNAAQLVNKLIYGKAECKKMVKGKSGDEILALAGIGIKTLKDGTKALTDYYQPSYKTTYSDINVEEAQLIQGVTKIFQNLNLLNTNLKNTGEISTVNGDVIIGGKHSLKDLSSLKNIYGSVVVYANSKEEALEQLKQLKFKPQHVGGKLIIIPDKISML